MGRLKQSNGQTAGTIISVVGLILLVIILAGCAVDEEQNPASQLDFHEFESKVSLQEDETTIGTNIQLHQEIHGKDGTMYRYKLETDCPHWKYEDRYLSDEPLAWVENHSAVETVARSIDIIWDGAVIATGQHFYVPLLDLYQDDMDYDTYKGHLLQSAYRQYLSSQDKVWGVSYIEMVVGSIAASVIILILCWPRITGKNPKRKKQESTQEENQILLIRHPDGPKYLVYVVDRNNMAAMLELIVKVKGLYQPTENQLRDQFKDQLEHNRILEHINAQYVGLTTETSIAQHMVKC